MLLTKYNNDKRNLFIICSAENEKLNQYKNLDEQNITNLLKSKYSADKALDIPYHYLVTDNKIVELKSTNLIHSDQSILSVYNNDIKILLSDDSALESNEELPKLIAELSEKYSLKISNSIIFIKKNRNKIDDENIDKLSKKSINIRNNNNAIFSIFEAVAYDKIILNEDIIMVNNREGYHDLANFAYKYCIPLNVLSKINPHLKINELYTTDTIFIPKTKALKGKMISINAEREVDYIINECISSIEGVMKKNG